jgi:hypothetical protein
MNSWTNRIEGREHALTLRVWVIVNSVLILHSTGVVYVLVKHPARSQDVLGRLGRLGLQFEAQERTLGVMHQSMGSIDFILVSQPGCLNCMCN